MINTILEGLRRIVNLGMAEHEQYCRTCGTWLKSRNDLDGHNNGFACGIANSLLKQWSKRKSLLDNKELIDKIAQRIANVPEQEWTDWKAKPFLVKANLQSSTSESYINDAVEIIKIFEGNSV